MTWDHERVEELLAAHALGGLDGDDASLAERALVEHVPECDRCRRAWDGYREVASDVGLWAAPAPTSQRLDARLARSISGAGALGAARPARPLVTAAAGIAALLVGLSGFSVIRASQLADRMEATERDQASLLGAISTVAHPAHQSVPLVGHRGEAVRLYYVPGERQGYLMAANLPPPRHSYQVWFVDDGDVWRAGSLRVRGGRGVLACRTDPRAWDWVMLTDEPGRRPHPRSSPIVSATVSPG